MVVRESIIEAWVGFFILIAIVALLVLAFKVSGGALDNRGYQVIGFFDNVGGLKIRSPVLLAGVPIGEVLAINLHKTQFKAMVKMKIGWKYKGLIPEDTSASILTQGLLGANYVSFIPGFSKNVLKNGSVIHDTHSALILEDLIGQLIFNLKKSRDKK